MDNFVVKPRGTRHRLLGYLILFVLLVVLLLGSTDLFGVYRWQNGGWSFKLPWLISRSLSPEELLSKNEELRERLLVLGQNNKVDKRATALLQEKLVDSQEEIFQLKKDLEFYQGIINATGASNSPRVHGLRVKRLLHAHGYRLELFFLNIGNTDEVVEGIITVVLEGVLDSTVKRLPLSDLSLDDDRSYSIRFRNFQRFENNFILPANFEPQRVFVTLYLPEQEEIAFEKILDWPETNERVTADVG